MRILHVADLHYRLDWYDWVSRQTDYEVLVIAGDLLNMFPRHVTSLPDQARVVQGWLEALTKPAVVCTGNHDVWLRHPRATPDVMAEGGWLQWCKHANLIVDGQTANIQDERFAAVKWGDTNWSDDATIVVSHAPPSEARVSINAEGTDWGDFEISMRVWEKRPKYVLSGHVHQPADWAVFEGASWCLNPGCDMEAAVPNHILIDTTKKMARWHTMRGGVLVKHLD